MRQVNKILCFIVLFITACNLEKKITGSKQNGSNYTITIKSDNPRSDSVILSGSIRVVGAASGENMATRGLQIQSTHTASSRQIVQPDDNGNFSSTLTPGKYYLFFGGIGFGKIKTKEFTLKKGQSAHLNAILYPEEEVMDDYIQTPYKTVPRRRPIE